MRKKGREREGGREINCVEVYETFKCKEGDVKSKNAPRI